VRGESYNATVSEEQLAMAKTNWLTVKRMVSGVLDFKKSLVMSVSGHSHGQQVSSQ
jgi:hypothetical protein